MNFLILPYFQHRGLENTKQPNLNRKTATSRLKKELFYFYRTAMVEKHKLTQRSKSARHEDDTRTIDEERNGSAPLA